mgnify:FL=1
MKLSTKGRYGLRAMIDLAVYSEVETVSISSISERQAISVSYLEQLVGKLRKAGLVNSIRGAQGGYVLAQKAEDISVGDILRALEGDLTPVDCAELSNETSCVGSEFCVTKFVWQRINNSINEAVNTMMLSELVDESKKVKDRDHTNTNCEI